MTNSTRSEDPSTGGSGLSSRFFQRGGGPLRRTLRYRNGGPSVLHFSGRTAVDMVGYTVDELFSE